MARYVIDAPTLLHLVGNDVPVGSKHQIVAPDPIRSKRYPCFLMLCGAATSPRMWRFNAVNA